MKSLLITAALTAAFCAALLKTSTYGDSRNIKLSPYRSGKYMYIASALLKIPPSHSYKQLSDKDKSRFRSSLRNPTGSIEPPYPRRGLRRILDPIYYTQNKQREQGVLDVIALVDQLGQVQKVIFYASPSKTMSKQVAYILFKTKFKPALCARESCAAEFELLAKFFNKE
jgi:hypothetical protein